MVQLIPPPLEERYRIYKALTPLDPDYGYWWYVNTFPEQQVSPQGRRCLNLINWVWKGIYNFHGGLEYINFGLDSVLLQTSTPLNTYDDDYLTRLVVAAHDHAIRVELRPGSRLVVASWQTSGESVMQVVLSPRDRIGEWHEYPRYYRHPTIIQAVMALHREEKYEVYQDPPRLGPTLELPRYTTGQLTHEDLNEVATCAHCAQPFIILMEEVILDGWSIDVFHVACFAAHGVEVKPCVGVALRSN